jgi:hypothetical protein
MTEFWQGLIQFPTVVFTILVGFVLAYWGFVMVGAADVDVLDGGAADGLLDGAADGAADGLLDGAADGVADGAADGAMEAAAHGAIEGGSHAATGLAGMFEVLALLGLRKAPVTVVGSLLVAWAWLFSYLAMYYLGGLFAAFWAQVVLGIGVFVGALACAVPLTSLSVRPMGRLFETSVGPARASLVGRMCQITTGRVTERFGMAKLEGADGSMLVHVRCDKPNALKRGDEALIVDLDRRRDAFLVEPLTSAEESALSKRGDGQ